MDKHEIFLVRWIKDDFLSLMDKEDLVFWQNHFLECGEVIDDNIQVLYSTEARSILL